MKKAYTSVPKFAAWIHAQDGARPRRNYLLITILWRLLWGTPPAAGRAGTFFAFFGGIMKTSVVIFLASCWAVSSAQAGQNVLGLNFVLSQPATFSAIGARNGGIPFTFAETVGIFNDSTGTLISPEAVFGPGEVGIQIGNVFFERFPSLVLSPGDYSIISISGGGSLPSGGGLLGGDSYQNLGNDLSLPEGGRFNFGTGFDTSPGTGPRGQLQPFFLTNLVPEGGMTAMLLGASMTGLAWARRKF
jgi:hypothetical protein